MFGRKAREIENLKAALAFTYESGNSRWYGTSSPMQVIVVKQKGIIEQQKKEIRLLKYQLENPSSTVTK